MYLYICLLVGASNNKDYKIFGRLKFDVTTVESYSLLSMVNSLQACKTEFLVQNAPLSTIVQFMLNTIDL